MSSLQGTCQEAKRRQKVYLGDKEPISLQGKTAIIVDDGIATGMTMLAAIKEVKTRSPRKTVVAVPVASQDASEKMKQEVDDFVVLSVPEFSFGAIGEYYENFRQVSDEEVIEILKDP